MTRIQVRQADRTEIDHLARLWHDGWRDAHATIVPDALARLRTLESFRERLEHALAETRVAGPAGAPVGFFILRGDELYQLYVSAESRGSGIAAVLMADAESRLSARGVTTAWLACAIGNHRAARFYEKCGWRRAGTMVNLCDTAEGPFPLEVWRYERRLTAVPA
jgi:GNAT superfamily N-acetyltransferase